MTIFKKDGMIIKLLCLRLKMEKYPFQIGKFCV